jgi:hypothetical protein
MRIANGHLCFPVIVVIIILAAANAPALDWPVWPDSTHRPISAIYGLTQGNYLHSGVDIAVPYGTPIYSMESGYVKAVMTLYGGVSSWRIVIGDSAGTGVTEAWMYAHVSEYTIPYDVGDYVEAGAYLGMVVNWPGQPSIVEHLHLSRIRYGGDSAAWADNFFTGWEFIADPFDYLDNIESINDTTAPFFDYAWGNQLYAYCLNQSVSYFDEGAPISGDVDVICAAYDYHDFYVWKDSPYKLEYKIEGDSSIPWTTSFILDFELGTYDGPAPNMQSLRNIFYQNDGFCNIVWTADSQALYFNVTNTDGDGIPEESDKMSCWSTADFHNGHYYVYTRAGDHVGHVTVESSLVAIENFFDLTGMIQLSGNDPDPSGTEISIIPDGQTDNTDETGNFGALSVGGGSQTATISRPGYEIIDTTFVMNQNHHLEITLQLGEFVCGDANFNGAINILDVSYLIEFLYLDGPAPIPFESGDANGNSAINILDITYLIAYLYQGGPAPANCYGI